MKKPYVVNIQKFSIHDGPGIRTTVFFKGCPLKCWWCHNPESQRYQREFLFDEEKCTGCGYCTKGCSQDAITLLSETHKSWTDQKKCILCGGCEDYCLNNNREIAGKQYEIEELVRILAQDKVFYEESGGGVTLSGGEVMTQNMEYLIELCKELKDRQLSIAVDTCGYAPQENFKKLLPYVDMFLYDLKLIDNETHQKYTGVSNTLILNNLEYLVSQNVNISVRIPVIPSVNDEEASLLRMITYLNEKIGNPMIHLLPYHNTGSSKYSKLGRDYPAKDFETPDNEKMEWIKKLFEQHGFWQVKIGG